MAYRQPTHHAPHRTYTSHEPPQQYTPQPEPLEDSQEWVVFEPSAPSTTRTHTTSTERTPRTAGLSRLSDFGSLDTAARSEDEYEASEHTEGIIEEGEEEDADEGELDSLDSHLHA